jgi:hypothetical protein
MSLVDHLNGPLCPQSYSPMAAAHALAIEFQNAAYRAAPKDDDGEMPPQAEAMYAALSSDRMCLYVENSGTHVYGGQAVSVQAWYWRCLICGFVLPATRNQP